MMYRKILFVILVLSTLIVLPLSAQDSESHPLMQMLALVPDTMAVRSSAPMVSYIDYRAIEEARGITTPAVSDFNEDTELKSLWLAAMNGVVAGPEFVAYLLSSLEETPELVGFELFDIDRAVSFGMPPAMGTILQGDFDTARIEEAFSARDYTVNDIEGVSVLCPSEGCDMGMKVNVLEANPANPFGGRIGRREPVAVASPYLLNSSDLPTLEGIIGAYNETQDTLADDPYFMAAAEAVTENGILRQALFFRFADVGVFPDSRIAGMLGDRVTPEMLEALTSDEANPMPPYLLAVIGDIWEGGSAVAGLGGGTNQVALVGLVYEDEESARLAGEVMLERIPVIQSFRMRRAYAEILEERGVTVLAPYVFASAETGKFVAVLPLSYPTPTNEPSEEFPTFIASGMTMRFIVDEIYSRSFTLIGADFLD